MFNLENYGVDLNVDVKVNKLSMPFYFKRKNECIHCCATGTLVFIDKFGRKSKGEEIRAFDHIECTNCGRVYGIKWESDGNSNKMYPSAVDLDAVRDFKNMINSNIKKNGVKEI